MYDARGTAKCKEFKVRTLDRRGGVGGHEVPQLGEELHYKP